MRWTSPEALESRKFNEKTDMWSFGVTAYEIWTRAVTPYKGWNNQKVWVEVANGSRLDKPSGCFADVYGIMIRCWSNSQELRPTALQVTQELRQLYKNYTGEAPPKSATYVELIQSSLSSGATSGTVPASSGSGGSGYAYADCYDGHAPQYCT